MNDERNLPADFRGMLPAAYDRRAVPRPAVIVDRYEYSGRFAADLRAMRARIAAENRLAREISAASYESYVRGCREGAARIGKAY